MTDTLIAIISIFMGMFSANLLGAVKKKYTMGFTGNTIAGIFGSIFFIKTLGRLGFDPMTIMKGGELNVSLFIINMLVSVLGGAIGLMAIKFIQNKLKKSR